MQGAKRTWWAGWALLPLILVGLPPSGLSHVEKDVPGGAPRHQDSAAALRVEVVDSTLLLDGHAIPFDSLRAAIAARGAESPPVIYRVMLPAALECERVEAILTAIGAGHKAVGQAAQYAHAPVLLGLAGTEDLNAVAMTVPMPAYRAMAYQADTVRRLQIAQQGELRVDGIACEWERLPSRLSSEPSEEGATPKPRTAWVYIAAHGEAPFVRLYQALRLARQAEVPCLSLWGPNALIDLEAPEGRRPVRHGAEPPIGSLGGPRQISAFDYPPQPIYRVDPVYPDSAAQLGLGGKIQLLVFVNEFGAAFKTMVLSATGPDSLSDAARAAASQWRFLPGWQRRGEPVKTTISIPFEFWPEFSRPRSKLEYTASSDSAAPTVEVYGWRPPADTESGTAKQLRRSSISTLQKNADGSLMLDGLPVPAESLSAAIARDCIPSPPAVYRLELPRGLAYSSLADLLQAIREGLVGTDRGSPNRVIPLVMADPDDGEAPAIPLLIRGQPGSQLLQGPGTLIELSLPETQVFEVEGRRWTAQDLAAHLESLVVAGRAPSLLLMPAESLPYADLFAVLRAGKDAGVRNLSLPGEKAIVDRDAWRPMDDGGSVAWPSERPRSPRPASSGKSKIVENDFEQPKPIHRVVPEMPDSLKEAGVKGAVKVLLFVDRTGLVSDAQVLSSNLPVALDSLALAAVRQWRFTPGKTKGRAVKTNTMLVFEFPPPPDR